MRFQDRTRSSGIPEVNLVPMMDVLMTVLTFFIIIAMTLTGTQLANVRLPQSVTGADQEPAAQTVDPLIVGLDSNGDLVMDNQPISSAQLDQRIRTYFGQNPEGKIILKADRDLSYETVADLLTELRAIGGNRVSLAVE
ncbi:biopolymer transporter ExbD [Pseudanabaena sp. FACHB-2040]|uniref:ExbD/TolR family protein n=1 Tax=Pseudanabaena sp. FACHB-2040 TaxID=2692859 RepID=UPI0016848E95|nr:biopolymer transporter ExbD [Pseudanabaena sp. FACHB-2040]MBD2260265.1 biopolymer transporter ExbD [Pseudanabaena sp. FACHB-2040]